MTTEEVIHILLTIKTESIYEDEAIRIAVEKLRCGSDKQESKT